MKGLEEILRDRILISDGAMGTMLQEAGLSQDGCPDELNLSRPKVVEDIHRAYIEAGAEMITTNTFGGNSIRLRQFGLQDKVESINSKGVEIARKASRSRFFIAASIGPTGAMLEPFGEMSFDEVYRAFRQQAEALFRAGCDLFAIETMTDLKELKAAVLACRDVSDLPICAQLSFEEGGRTVTGTDAKTAAVFLSALRVSILGSNCGSSLPNMEGVVRIMGEEVWTPIVAQPNAGVPRIVDGRPVFDADPEEMAEFARRFVELGANVVGSCCGSTPEHTRQISKCVRGMRPVTRKLTPCTRITSRSKTVYIGEGHPFLLVGERINPTGRKNLAEEIKKEKFALVRREAIEQVRRGVGALDVNVSVEGVEEAPTMERAVTQIQNLTDVPLFIDSLDRDALEAGLKAYVGKPVVNSVTGEKERLEEVLPLVRRYGASVVALGLDEEGVAETPAERLKVAEHILEVAQSYGLDSYDLIFDPVVLTAGSSQELVSTALRTLQLLKESLGVATIAGISNISHGLPNRSLLNRSFLEMAIGLGLDSGIADPYDDGIWEAVRAGELLTGRDREGRRYIAFSGALEGDEGRERSEPSLYEQIILGSTGDLTERVDELVREGREPLSIVEETIVPALQEVGHKFERGDYFLPQVISSARAAEEAISLIRPLIGEGSERGRGRIVIATVKGDIHDIGKNLVTTMLRSYNYEVIDLGKDVESSLIVNTALEERADVVALSALMTTTMVVMEEVVGLLHKGSFEGRILVGGAVVTQGFADSIGASYGKDALEAVERVEALLRGGSGG